ncbi:MAG: hypothetical protein PVF05_05460 [Gemmatimonadales bacterium]
MSVAVVLGPGLAALTSTLEACGAGVQVRDPSSDAADRATALRELLAGGADRVLLVERALPVRPDWARSGALFALVADHINLTGDNPLVGPNAGEWGPRFPDLTDAWDPGLRRAIRRAALASGFEALEGVVAGVAGNGRTSAEVGMLRMIGADMASTGFVSEAIVARHAGRRVAGIAVLSMGTELPDEAGAVETMARAALEAVAAEAETAGSGR